MHPHSLKSLYSDSLALLTDVYQLTMAYGFWKEGLADREAVYHLFFRRKPFQGSFALAAGLEIAASFIENFRFQESDLTYLATLKGRDGAPLFESAFLDYLRDLRFEVDIDAVEEGTPLFPYEPLLRVKGPILQAQLLETPLLNIINFQTLIATKASRICAAAEEDEVIEFGVRRSQGIDGAISAGRAAYIGGCHGTSTVLVGKLFDVPVKGTHAHSWVMAFDNEREAFDAYARAFPSNAIFLVDTYDTLQGVDRAIEVSKNQKDPHFSLIGVRIDSGDLAHLSIAIRRRLDEAGYRDAKIVASNELDEFIIRDLKQQGAQIDVWGVGTNLVTGKGQPALDGVYKLAAMRDEKGQWTYKLKISEQLMKVTDPGILQIRRLRDHSGYQADIIYDELTGIESGAEMIAPLDPSMRRTIGDREEGRDLLIPIFRKGKRVYDFPHISLVRQRAKDEIAHFHPSVRRFLHPNPFFVGLERRLYEKKLALINEIKSCKH